MKFTRVLVLGALLAAVAVATVAATDAPADAKNAGDAVAVKESASVDAAAPAAAPAADADAHTEDAPEAAAVPEEPTDVTTLNADTYKGWIKDKKLALVELYAPWCGHCKALAPEYEKAATTLKAEGIELAKVDCTENMDLCKELDIQGFPTMIVYQNGEKSEYEGTRKADGIVSYMRKQLLPAVSILTADKVAEFAKGDEMSLIGTFSSEDSDEYREFSNAASKLRNKYLFGAVIDAKASKASITLHRKFDDPETAFTGAKISLDAIKTFLKDESIPLLDDISPQNFRDYAETKLPLAFVFYGSGEQRVDNDAAVRAVAKEFKGKVAFVHLDANKFDFMADNLNLKKEWPAFGIQKLDDMTKYPFSQEKKITTADIRSFVTDFVAGKIAASIKSEPIPEKNDGPVKVVVADQFKEIVQDKTKDVLLAYTAPWCGHCKRMKEAYEKLGTALKEAKGLVIANFNGADNDIPISDSEYQFQGFPTIKLIKADSNEVVEYNGNRTLESFVEFIAEHATHNELAKEILPKIAEEAAKEREAEKKNEESEWLFPEAAEEEAAAEDAAAAAKPAEEAAKPAEEKPAEKPAEEKKAGHDEL